MGYYVESNGTKIYYRIEGEGEPLVLLMGFGADGDVWEKHLVEYRKYFKCIILDNRGVGKSDQPQGPYTTSIMASDTVAVMRHAGVHKAKVVGISMGGAIAQELALNYPQMVVCLVLVSTWPKFNIYATALYDNLKKLRVTSKPNEFTQLLQLWIFAPPFFESGLDTLLSAQKSALEDNSPQSQKGFEGQLDACIQHDTVARLGEINVPTLITVGAKDIFTPPEFSEILHEGIKGSRLILFPNGGHVHHWEDLVGFNDITIDFLKNN